MFGTRLTRVTRLLRDRDRDRALARVADSVNDWAGGTRIGESFRDVQPALGAADAADVGRRHRRLGRLGPRRPGARRDRDRPAAAQLPPPGLAQPAGRHARLPAARRRDARGLSRTSTTSCRPGPSPASSASARSSAASGASDTRAAASEAAAARGDCPRRPAVPAVDRAARTSSAATDRSTHPLARPTPMKELLETLDRLGTDGRCRRRRAGRSSSGRSGRAPRPGGRRPARTRR